MNLVALEANVGGSLALSSVGNGVTVIAIGSSMMKILFNLLILNTIKEMKFNNQYRVLMLLISF